MGKLNTISVDFIDHVLELSLGWILSERPHDCSQFLGSDRAVAILVKQREGFFELSDLLLSQLIGLETQSSMKPVAGECLNIEQQLYFDGIGIV